MKQNDKGSTRFSPSAGSPQICCMISFWARCSLFFFLVSEPGLSEPSALLLICLVSEPGWCGPGTLFFFGAWYLGHVQLARFIYLDQGSVCQVLTFFLLGIWARWSLSFFLGIWAKSKWARCVSFFCLVSLARYAVCQQTVKNVYYPLV